MITCKECRERLHPEDPSVPAGKYHHSTCDYFCDKPAYFRELEKTPIETRVEHIHFHSNLSKKEWDEMEQTRLRTLHLQGILKEFQDKKRVDKQYKY